MFSDIDMILVKEMTSEHIPRVAEIEKLSFTDPWSADALELLVGDRANGLVAVEDEEVLGYVGMMCVLDECQIINVAVHPFARRKGIGGLLMRSAEDYAGKRGITVFSLEVRASNTAARSLYRKLGWTECGIRKNFYSHPSEDAYVMIKNI